MAHYSWDLIKMAQNRPTRDSFYPANVTLLLPGAENVSIKQNRNKEGEEMVNRVKYTGT